MRSVYQNKACFCFVNKKVIVQLTIMSVFDYGDVFYSHAACFTFKLLDAVYRRTFHFNTGDKYSSIILYYMKNTGWTSPQTTSFIY